MNKRRAILFGLLLFYIFLRGIGDHGLIDPVEGVNASISAHMAGVGNYFVPKIGEASAAESAMGSIWLSVLGLKLFGWSEFGARFFSALAGLGMVLVSAKSARPYEDDTVRKSWLSASVCAGTTMCFIVSQLAAAYSLYAFLTGLAMSGIMQSGRSKRSLITAHTAIGLAFISYGFEGLILPMLAVLIYCIISEDWELMEDFFTWPYGITITLLISCIYYVILVNANPGIIHFMRCQNHTYSFGGIYGIIIMLFAGFVPFHGFIARAFYEVFPREYPAKKSYDLFLVVWGSVFFISALVSGDILAVSACIPAISALSGRKIDVWLTQRSFKSLRYAVMMNIIIIVPVMYLLLPFVSHNFPMIEGAKLSLIPWGLAEGLFIFASWYYTKTRQPVKWARNVCASALICLMPLAGVFNLAAGMYSSREAGMKIRETARGNDVIIQYTVNHPSLYFYTLRNARIIDSELTSGVSERKFLSPRSLIDNSWGGKGRVFLMMPSELTPDPPLPPDVYQITEGEGLLLLSNQ